MPSRTFETAKPIKYFQTRDQMMVFCCSIHLKAQVVERPLRELEVAGSKLGRAIPKALKMVPVATLLGAQHYKASLSHY